jgi:uncharacterized protein
VTRRGWLVGGAAAVAALLLVGRVVAGWYVDYLWYEALGALDLWRARALDLLILRGAAFAIGALFVFLNLYAVRHSVVSLVLPRRVGNLEIGEEVSGRYLLFFVLLLSVGLGLLLALPHGDWVSLDLVRRGESFRESDPYFQFDLAFWVYWLPLESEFHLWSLIALLAVTLVVTFLYALTPSLRWEGGRLRVTAYVRRHFFVIGAALLVILGWSYRLDAYRLLLEGSGAMGTFSALDHRVGIPSNLILALGTVAAAILLLWTGWFGQLRLAFATVSAVLLLALGLRQLLPPIVERFLSPADQEARDASYFKIRAGYTRRAYDIDRVARPESLPAPLGAAALRGVALWDPTALERAIARERRGSTLLGATGWDPRDGRLRAVLVEQGSAEETDAASETWNAVLVEADVATEQGGPAGSSIASGALELPPALVHEAAPGYRVVTQTVGGLAAASLGSFASRLAHAWALQNPALLRGDRSDSSYVMLHRDVRRRVRRLYPFFEQGTRVAPVVHRDSLFWTVHLYATSAFYPLSDPVRVGNEELRYFRHAAVALVNAHTGRVIAVADPAPDPVTASWTRRFPRLFVAASALDGALAVRLPPPSEAALLHARLFALIGPRGDNGPPSHLPRQLGGDTLFAYNAQAPFVDVASGRLSLAYPVLDAAERVRGIVVATGGAEYDVRWEPSSPVGPRWGTVLDRLHRALDSASQGRTGRETPLMRGPVRVVPLGDARAYVQTAYTWRADGTPAVRLVAVLLGDTVRTGATVASATGLPPPALPSVPLSPEEFRSRVASLYGEMREALTRGDWLAFGTAYEALGRLLRAGAAKP